MSFIKKLKNVTNPFQYPPQGKLYKIDENDFIFVGSVSGKYYISKLNNNGFVIWEKYYTFNNNDSQNYRTVNIDDVIIDSNDSSIYILGHNGNGWDYYYYLLKIDLNNGNVILFKGTENIIPKINGSLIYTGYSFSFSKNNDKLILSIKGKVSNNDSIIFYEINKDNFQLSGGKKILINSVCEENNGIIVETKGKNLTITKYNRDIYNIEYSVEISINEIWINDYEFRKDEVSIICSEIINGKFFILCNYFAKNNTSPNKSLLIEFDVLEAVVSFIRILPFDYRLSLINSQNHLFIRTQSKISDQYFIYKIDKSNLNLVSKKIINGRYVDIYRFDDTLNFYAFQSSFNNINVLGAEGDYSVMGSFLFDERTCFSLFPEDDSLLLDNVNFLILQNSTSNNFQNFNVIPNYVENISFNVVSPIDNLITYDKFCEPKIIENYLIKSTFLLNREYKDFSLGKLVIENYSLDDIVISSGTKIHESISIGGLIFTIKNEITIAKGTKSEVEIFVNGKTNKYGDFSNVIEISGIINPNNYKFEFIIDSSCPANIAFVIDESGSLTETDTLNIKNSLFSFIESPVCQNYNVSFIGMSDSDTNNRQDNIINKIISDKKSDFLSWIEGLEFRYKGNNDFWASGLELITSSLFSNTSTVPDLIIVIANGSDCYDINKLQNLISQINSKSHLFFIGTESGDYHVGNQNTNSEFTFNNIQDVLSFWYGREPIMKTDQNTFFTSDYTSSIDFSDLLQFLEYLKIELKDNKIGCESIAEITKNEVEIPSYFVGKTYTNNNAGRMEITNKSRYPFTITEDTKIHASENIVGLKFTTKTDVTIPPHESAWVEIKCGGTTTNEGLFSEQIYLNEKILNPQSFKISFTVLSKILIDNNTKLQATDFYLQAVGSLQDEDCKGISLRWEFGGHFGENHIPKGDLATTSNNYNKADDFVRIYRSPYVRVPFNLDLSIMPNVIDDSLATWAYTFESGRIIHISFKDKELYNFIRQNYDPSLSTLDFLQHYTSNDIRKGIIEVETLTDLFFGFNFYFSQSNGYNIYAKVNLEGLSIAENNLLLDKNLLFRKSYNNEDILNVQGRIENGRVLRLNYDNCFVTNIEFEFYSDFILNTNNIGWELIDKYALSLDDNEVFSRLDPTNFESNKKWLRYNENAYTKIENYKEKWSKPREISWDRNIKQIVEKYIQLSDNDNLKAEEYINFNLANNLDGVGAESDFGSQEGTLISNLDLLKVSALDFHIARMLGFGAIDVNSLSNQEFVYIAKYEKVVYTNTTAKASVVVPGGYPNQMLISMSLPVSDNTKREPIPVTLSNNIVFGSIDSGQETTTNLYDENGYYKDGKSRLINLFNKKVFSFDVNPTFFVENNELDATKFTLPIYAGVKYRLVKPNQSDINVWEKPEIAHDIDYLNYDEASNKSYETIPIILNEEGLPLISHIQKFSGNYIYASYGIDWFSRSSIISEEISISTEIKPKNTLLPPSDVNAFYIVKENPLMFSSGEEQLRLSQISSEDKTLARLIFSYNHQDLITYPLEESETLETSYETTPSDDLEIFGDEIEIYFRNKTPRIISAKVKEVTRDNVNHLLLNIKTEKYIRASDGEILESVFPEGTNERNFIGSLLLLDGVSYIVHSVSSTEDVNGLKFQVFDKEVTQAILSGNNASIEYTNLVTPEIEGDGLFVVTENMQTAENWESTNPNSLKIKIGEDWQVNRELITKINDNGSIQKFVEKSRGFWKNATITEFKEKHILRNSNGDLIGIDGTLLPENSEPVTIDICKGIYQITFNDFALEHHSQYFADKNPVDWYNGIVRLFTKENFNDGDFRDFRTTFKVFKTENIGTTNDLVLYIIDENFKYDIYNGEPSDENTSLLLGNNILVNYYPSYKVYLYQEVSNNFTKTSIYPNDSESIYYSIFGLRTVDKDYRNVNNEFYKSSFSNPALLFVQKNIEPAVPEMPLGALYATRPDFYGKSTYTFTVAFKQKPYAVQFYRADENMLLNTLYEENTIERIKNSLKILGGKNEEFFTNRWTDFLSDLSNKIDYEEFPKTGDYKFTMPKPDNKEFYKNINNFIVDHNNYYNEQNPLIVENEIGSIVLNKTLIDKVEGKHDKLLLSDFIKDVINNCFLPLTEIPVIYEHIYGGDYLPLNKKQNIRDKNGYLLKPQNFEKDNNGFIIKSVEDEYDMAPMIKGISNNKLQFTDFTLDGTTDNFYFYGVREIGTQMKLGEFSPFLGPIKLVDTNAPEAPKIKSVLPILENKVLGITPKVKIEIQSYTDIQKISKISLYKTHNRIDAESILSMKLIKSFNLEDIETLEGAWIIYDNFDDSNVIPYGESLYYRVVVEKKVEYSAIDYMSQNLVEQIVVDYVPSQSSKIFTTVLVETSNPTSPDLYYEAEKIIGNNEYINGVVLKWNALTYKGTYHIYKMTSQGNWAEIAKIIADQSLENTYQLFKLNNGAYSFVENLTIFDNEFYITLASLGLEPLPIKNSNEDILYYHFKVIVENTSGMFSTEEKILTLFREDTVSNLEGISHDGIDGMIISGNFIIRPN